MEHTPKEEEIREDFHKYSLFMANAVENGDAEYKDIEKSIADYWLKIRREAIAEEREETKLFILNVLKGIDIADEEMGNKGGGTQAIRLAFKSRGII